MTFSFLSVPLMNLEYELCACLALAVCLKFRCLVSCLQTLSCVPFTYGIWISHPWEQCTRCLTKTIGLVCSLGFRGKEFEPLFSFERKMTQHGFRTPSHFHDDVHANRTENRRPTRRIEKSLMSRSFICIDGSLQCSENESNTVRHSDLMHL